MVGMPTFPKDRQHFNIAIFVMLRNKQGEYLLQQRQNTSFLNGFWDTSASGHLERGETIKECIVREAEEEAGVRVNIDSLKLVHVSQPELGNWPYIDFVFFSDDFEGEPLTNEAEKVSALEWFKPEDFPENLTLAATAYKNAGFPTDTLSYSFVNEADFERITGQKYEREP